MSLVLRGPPGEASPDPCVDERSTDGDGDVTIGVLSSHASTWNVGTALPVLRPGVGGVTEGDDGTVVVNVPITLSAPSASTVTVDYTTIGTSSPGIAAAGLDYVATSGTLSFAPGETTKTVSVTVNGDLIDEPPALYGEWIPVAFSSPVGASLDTSFLGLGIGIIVDDDPTPVIHPGIGSVIEGNAGTVGLQVPVTLPNPSAVPVTVRFRTVTGVGRPGQIWAEPLAGRPAWCSNLG